jgi:putative endonuclease
MKDICCYILWSEKLKRFYIGATQDSLENRIQKHLSGFYEGQSFTKKAEDWKLVLSISADDFNHALRIERKIKSMKSSKYIKNLIQYLELIDKIVLATKLTP